MALECFMLRIKEDKANDVFKTAGTDFISMKWNCKSFPFG